MKITTNFSGANLKTARIVGQTVFLENNCDGFADDWFYFAFCVEDAEGQTLTFQFDSPNRIGYAGAAVSHDLKEWHWSNSRIDGATFTYSFSKGENRVYFAHDMLYSPKRLMDFAKRIGLSVQTLGKSRKGREIPCFSFGEGERSIVLTARHHACESTGSYVLEGVLETLYHRPIPHTRIFCVPMMDYDGVCDGEQGKGRLPHDHNQDYDPDETPLYETTAAVRAYIEQYAVGLGFDFHSPWHLGGKNDQIFLVRKALQPMERADRFSALLMQSVTPQAMRYDSANDMPANSDWNRDTAPTFASYILKKPWADLAVTLETCYFGEDDNRFTQDKGIAFGRCFAEALRKYLAGESPSAEPERG